MILKNRITLKFALFVSIAFMLSACSDPCEDIVCLNNGIENEIDRNTCECICEPAFEGDFCDNETREKFYGTYSGPENCGQFGTFNSTMTVSSENTSENSELRFEGIFEPGTSLIAVLESSDWKSFTIAQQTTGNYTISGTGSFIVDTDGNVESVEIDYIITQGTNTGECSTTKNRD